MRRSGMSPQRRRVRLLAAALALGLAAFVLARTTRPPLVPAVLWALRADDGRVLDVREVPEDDDLVTWTAAPWTAAGSSDVFRARPVPAVERLRRWIEDATPGREWDRYRRTTARRRSAAGRTWEALLLESADVDDGEPDSAFAGPWTITVDGQLPERVDLRDDGTVFGTRYFGRWSASHGGLILETVPIRASYADGAVVAVLDEERRKFEGVTWLGARFTGARAEE